MASSKSLQKGSGLKEIGVVSMQTLISFVVPLWKEWPRSWSRSSHHVLLRVGGGKDGRK